MYAVIETGGKQYRVEVGTELEVELLDVEPGQSITLDRVLLVADGDRAAVGQPVVTDAMVAADVVRQLRGEKLISFKYRPKARRRVTKGHRQELTLLRISDIVFEGRSAAADAEAVKDAARTERERLEEAARRQAAADAELAAQLAAKAPVKSTRLGRAGGTAAPGDETPAKAPTRGAAKRTSGAAESPGRAGKPAPRGAGPERAAKPTPRNERAAGSSDGDRALGGKQASGSTAKPKSPKSPKPPRSPGTGRKDAP